MKKTHTQERENEAQKSCELKTINLCLFFDICVV